MAIGSFSGINSGIDWRGMIDQIMQLESQPLARVKTKISQQQSRSETWGKLQTSLGKLRTQNDLLRNGTAFRSMSATVSPTSTGVTPFSATLTSAAEAADYLVEVTSLARAETWSSKGYADSTTALLLNGDFSINGKTITVASADSLAAVRDKINAADAGVSAGLVNVSSTEVRLVITSKTMGAAGVNYVDGTNAVGTSMGFVETVAGSDAVIKVNGVTVNRQTNSISDAITGVTLNLHQTSGAEQVTLAVRSDLDKITGNVKEWVKQYNEVRNFIKDQKTVTNDKRQPLYGDSGLKMIERMLYEAVQPQLSSATGATYTKLHEVGLSIDRNGNLEFDESAFKDALTKNPSAVETFFNRSVATTDAAVQYVAATSYTKPGTYALNLTQVAATAAVTGGGFGGTYASAAPETITFTETHSSKVANVVLTNGMSTADVVNAMNTEFQAQGLKMIATNVAGQVKVEHQEYGSARGFSVTHTDAGVSQLGIAAGAYSGLDVQGTIGGLAATGSGQYLTGAAGTDVAGLQVRVTGGAIGARGDVIVEHGVGSRLDASLIDIYVETDSIILQAKDNISRQISRLEDQTNQMESRLEVRRKRLETQFMRMEEMVSLFNSQSQWLSGQIAALNAQKSQ